MKQFILQSIGIDISEDSFNACIYPGDTTGNVFYGKVVEFKNNNTGFNQFVRWYKNLIRLTPEFVIIMEAKSNKIKL